MPDFSKIQRNETQVPSQPTTSQPDGSAGTGSFGGAVSGIGGMFGGPAGTSASGTGAAVGGGPQHFYQFYLEKCVITNTRSVNKDTLLAGFGAIVTSGGKAEEPRMMTAKLGDHNNTTFGFWEKGLGALSNIGLTPNDRVTFLYEIYNNGAHGHPNDDELRQLLGYHLKLQAAMDALQNSDPAVAQLLASQQDLDKLKADMAAASSQGATTAAVATASVFTGGLYGVFYSVLQGCDGIVAAGSYSTDGKSLAARVASSPNNVIAQTDTSNGKQNKWGAPCNPHGSNYLVSWILQTQP